jgi:DNA (cytosine-5)-methyltransferase 1
MTKTLKLGSNRGNPRLWLEGATLTAAGFTRGARYNVELGSAAIVLTLDTDGARKVAGKSKSGSDHPIIDMNGAMLTPFAGRELTLTTHAGMIVISKEV